MIYSNSRKAFKFVDESTKDGVYYPIQFRLSKNHTQGMTIILDSPKRDLAIWIPALLDVPVHQWAAFVVTVEDGSFTIDVDLDRVDSCDMRYVGAGVFDVLVNAVGLTTGEP